MRESEKTFNPDITEVKLVVRGIPNKVYSQGMETRDMWEEAFRRFGRENSMLNAADFYVALLIDLRSMSDNGFLESGLRLVNVIGRVQLAINRKALGSSNQACQKVPATGDIAGYFFSCAGYSSSVKKKNRKLKEKRKVLNLVKPRMKCLILLEVLSVVFCISECFSMIFTRCNPMPADMTRCKMIACCFLCAN